MRAGADDSEPIRRDNHRIGVTYAYSMPGDADETPDPPTTSRVAGYPIDNRDAVIGPLPKAAPPVLGEWAGNDP